MQINNTNIFLSQEEVEQINESLTHWKTEGNKAAGCRAIWDTFQGKTRGQYRFCELDLRGLGLTSMPTFPSSIIQKMTHITVMNLSYNRIQDTEMVPAFPNLKKLYYAHNDLKDISALARKKFPNLELVSLACNAIETLPDLTGSCLEGSHLKNPSFFQLRLGNNLLRDEEITKLKNSLKNIDVCLSNNPGNDPTEKIPLILIEELESRSRSRFHYSRQTNEKKVSIEAMEEYYQKKANEKKAFMEKEYKRNVYFDRTPVVTSEEATLLSTKEDSSTTNPLHEQSHPELNQIPQSNELDSSIKNPMLSSTFL